MAGIRAPENFPTRDPRSAARMNGRNANPPRFNGFGNATGPGLWNRETGELSHSNIAALEKGGPTGRKVSKSSTRKNLD